MLLLPTRAILGEEKPAIAFQSGPNQLAITVGGKPFATYVYRDEKISRPYFAHVFSPAGIQVTRNHPPIEGKDATDHSALHPGIWLAFGDVSGNDDWRLRAEVNHDGFVSRPKGDVGTGVFEVRNRYLTADGKQTVCVERCRYTFFVRPSGYLLISDSQFSSENGEFYFGDQEEMGLGVRLATPLAVENGGRIIDSQGRVNEQQVWGKQAAWCDYSGTINGQALGITIMPDPGNFGPCWYHARDYGFMAANPFGRNAFTRGNKSKVVVKKGQSLRLRYGVLLHGRPADKPLDRTAAYEDYLTLQKRLD